MHCASPSDLPTADVLQETLPPLLKILRQQGSSWRARVDSGLDCAAPPLYLRTLNAVRDCARSAGAAELEASASAILGVLARSQPPGQGLGISTLDIIERAIASLGQGGGAAWEELARLSAHPSFMSAPDRTQRTPPMADDSQPQPWRSPQEDQWQEGLQDELDQTLLPVFLEEAQELMGSVGEGLEALRQGVADAELAGLERPLHTLKGSARMVGARRLSHCLHQMETALRGVQASTGSVQGHGGMALAALEALLRLHDLALDHFAALTQAAWLPAADDGTRASVLPAPLIRIRTTVLDKLLNQVGEVSIARARLDNEVGSLHSESKSLGEQLAQLSAEVRQWLRQSEASAGGSTDKLAATQGLACSLVARLEQASLHQRRLQEGVSSAREGLRQQAAHTRDLQQELMYARMVKFNSMEVRMQHLVRQVAAETGKPLALDLSNCRLQIDRAILERLMGPLEHLLRNAAVHGIESAELRLAEGKPAVGRLTVQATHEGNEAVIRVSDDGRGLDLEAIRQKALELGAAGVAEASQARLADLIFQPGLSTSPQVSALPGAASAWMWCARKWPRWAAGCGCIRSPDRVCSSPCICRCRWRSSMSVCCVMDSSISLFLPCWSTASCNCAARRRARRCSKNGWSTRAAGCPCIPGIACSMKRLSLPWRGTIQLMSCSSSATMDSWPCWPITSAAIAKWWSNRSVRNWPPWPAWQARPCWATARSC